MDKQTRDALVHMAAQIEVLTFVTKGLASELIGRLQKDEGEQLLDALQYGAGDLPPQSDPSNPEATRFYEEIAAIAPGIAESFVQSLRKARG